MARRYHADDPAKAERSSATGSSPSSGSASASRSTPSTITSTLSGMDRPGPMRFGLQLWSQATGWPGFRDAALAAEDAGWDSVWTWDHLLAIFGPWEQPIFEGWTVLAALAPITSSGPARADGRGQHGPQPGRDREARNDPRPPLGRRAVLGIGGAWFDREHEAYGIEFGASPGDRLAWLDESVMLLRRLLDGERFDHERPAVYVPRRHLRAAT